MARAQKRLRLPHTLLVMPQGRSILCIDYLTKRAVTCTGEALYWLGCFRRWANPAAVARRHPDFDRAGLVAQFAELVSLGLLLQEGSSAAREEERLRRRWKYGMAAAVLHFTCSNSRFMDLSQSQAEQKRQLVREKQPQLFWKPPGHGLAPPLSLTPRSGALLALMAQRRSCRTPTDDSISRGQLVTCLLAGLAITGFTHNGVSELPLKMTPSGGARNPFEAFVLARRVTGLAPGLHRFSGLDGSLTPLKRGAKLSGAAVLAGQDWGENMPAIILLVGFLSRAMWKYREANAYRVLLIEAGHIAQNMMLAACAEGLATCPTAALDHHLISTHLRLDEITEAPIYAVALCRPGISDDPYTENKRLAPLLSVAQ